MFFNSRIVSPTPPSLVKFSCSTLSLITGLGDSTPIQVQVPRLM